MKETITYVEGQLKAETQCICDDCCKPFIYDEEEGVADTVYHQFYTNYKGQSFYERMLCEDCGKKAIEDYKQSNFYEVKVYSYDDVEDDLKQCIDEYLYRDDMDIHMR